MFVLGLFVALSLSGRLQVGLGRCSGGSAADRAIRDDALAVLALGLGDALVGRAVGVSAHPEAVLFQKGAADGVVHPAQGADPAPVACIDVALVGAAVARAEVGVAAVPVAFAAIALGELLIDLILAGVARLRDSGGVAFFLFHLAGLAPFVFFAPRSQCRGCGDGQKGCQGGGADGEQAMCERPPRSGGGAAGDALFGLHSHLRASFSTAYQRISLCQTLCLSPQRVCSYLGRTYHVAGFSQGMVVHEAQHLGARQLGRFLEEHVARAVQKLELSSGQAVGQVMHLLARDHAIVFSLQKQGGQTEGGEVFEARAEVELVASAEVGDHGLLFCPRWGVGPGLDELAGGLGRKGVAGKQLPQVVEAVLEGLKDQVGDGQA